MYDYVKRGKTILKEYPSLLIIVSSLFMVMCGIALLSLPFAQKNPLSLVDIIFTSTSMSTVTGTLTVTLNDFTFFGQCIILLFMQIGGLGLMTLSLFTLALFSKIGIYTHVLAQDILSIDNYSDTKKMILFMIKLTVITEMIGTFLSLFYFARYYPFGQAIFLSIFHSVSAFCNAGISFHANSMIPMQHDAFMIISTSLLMIIGGLGFLTWYDIFTWVNNKNENRPIHFPWHSKLMIKTYFTFTAIQGILFWLLERNNSLAQMNVIDSVCNIFFFSIATKSTGFIALPMSHVHIATIFLIIIFLIIGSVPTSTGSGIKLGNILIASALLKNAIFDKEDIEIAGKRIGAEQVYKSLSIILLTLLWLIICTFILLITEQQTQFVDILFEVAAALSNGGIPTGLTEKLSVIGKIAIIITMLIGRFGGFALIVGIKRNLDVRTYSYPEEKIILG
jgi:trk system potassium uptake protein TrkH